jgi:hypothetical protein
MAMLSLQREAWVLHLVMNKFPSPFRRGKGEVGFKNHNAALSDGAGGALWLPFYCLRRDATALGLLLLSMLDITSSFH